MEGSLFFRGLHHSSSEESSPEEFSLRSDRTDQTDNLSDNREENTDSNMAALSFHSESNGDSLETPEAVTVPMSPPVDPAPTGILREMYYNVEGYQHHRRAVEYAADNNFTAAFQEWKLAYLFKYYPALYYLGNAYNQGKGVEKNLRKVFQHQICMTFPHNCNK